METQRQRYRIFIPHSHIDDLPADISIIEAYPAFVIAESSADILEKAQQNYPIEVLPQAKPAPSIPNIGRLRSAVLAPRSRGPYLKVIRYQNPIRETWLEELAADHNQRLTTIGSSTLVVLSPNKTALSKLKKDKKIISVSDFRPDIRLNKALMERVEGLANNAKKNSATRDTARREIRKTLALPGRIVATFFNEKLRDNALRKLQRELNKPAKRLQAMAQHSIIINLLGSDTPLVDIKRVSKLFGLKSITEQRLRRTFNNLARNVIARGINDEAPHDGIRLTGKGEIVAVSDSGLDTGDPATIHPDFQGRILDMQSFPLSEGYAMDVLNPGADDGAADASGHGTHVAGSVLGDGSASISLGLEPIKGVAPEAQLVFQALEQKAEWKPEFLAEYQQLYGITPGDLGLMGIPDHVPSLFQTAYDVGARIHSNSWGGGTPGAYDYFSHDVDEFVWQNPDFLILAAAGNEGEDLDDNPGQIDLMSIASPGTAKNCVTVGASENTHAEFPWTYSEVWPISFFNEPYASDGISDSIDDVACFSSRGPCDTGRLKPDVVAPGTFILSTRSSQEITDPHSMNPEPGQFATAPFDYKYESGTSMATPLVAGCAALLREYLRKHRDMDNPSAAMLKAGLIHSAVYMDYKHRLPDSKPWADIEQGWGRVSLKDIIAPESPRWVSFIDESEGLTTGTYGIYDTRVIDSSVPLKITMAYSDYPGIDLINNLNLMLMSPDKTFYMGNDQGDRQADSTNNVERIQIEAPDEGVWTVYVVGSNVPQPLQKYALVISGGLGGV